MAALPSSPLPGFVPVGLLALNGRNRLRKCPGDSINITKTRNRLQIKGHAGKHDGEESDALKSILFLLVKETSFTSGQSNLIVTVCSAEICMAPSEELVLFFLAFFIHVSFFKMSDLC